MVGMSSEGDLQAQFTSEVSDFVVMYNSYTHAYAHTHTTFHSQLVYHTFLLFQRWTWLPSPLSLLPGSRKVALA